jgi:tetratricopeptide (TPR) repeat protein
MKNVLFLIFLFSCSCTIFFSKNFRQHLDAAEKAEREQNYQEAISQYEQHIKFRKKDDDRLPQENPWFYKLMVGELYLKIKDPIAAENAFLDALKHKVSPALCAERLRRIAIYYEQEKEIEKAFEILRKHRELDPVLFDLEIDRIHKASLGD